MKFIQVFLVLSGLLGTILGCKTDPRLNCTPVQSKINTNIRRFDVDFDNLHHQVDLHHLTGMFEKYPDFFPLYCNSVIKVGHWNDTATLKYISMFLNDPVYRQVRDTTMKYFSNAGLFEEAFSKAFTRMHCLLPKIPVPEVCFHLSGFNESVIVTPKEISFSIENYLGEKNLFYSQLGVYTWKRSSMRPEFIVRDGVYAWLSTEYTEPLESDNLLAKIIYKGKVAFALAAVCPDVDETIRFGFTDNQLKWARQNEKAVWLNMVEQKALFSSSNEVYRNFLSPGPFTASYGSNSAPRMGEYIGYCIVKSFFERNKDVSLEALMTWKDAQQLLQLSGYKP